MSQIGITIVETVLRSGRAARVAAVLGVVLLPACGTGWAGGEEPAVPGLPAPAGRQSPGLRMARPEEVGMDSAALAEVDEVIRRAIINSATPGAALAVGRYGRLVRLAGYGTLDWAPGSAPVTDSTLYDLASLTKVVGTTTAVMILVDEGKIDLDAPVSRYLPEWHGDGDKARVTVRHLLLHNSGLPAHAPLWRELRGPEAYLRRIGAMTLDYPPGTRTVYSDLGIILLGFIVERQSGTTLDRFLADRVFGPLGMRDTGFRPVALGEPGGVGAGRGNGGSANGAAAIDARTRIAPTEVDTVFRMRHIHGDVHDENAYALGGVAGHAGLFSSARDLAVFAQMLLDRGSYAGYRLIRPETVDLFTRRHSPASSRALGWDTPSGERSSAGDYFSSRSFGHTGFTGTSIWIDPERSLFVVLLTNRVNPTRANNQHAALRREVHDAVQRAIIDVAVERRADAGR